MIFSPSSINKHNNFALPNTESKVCFYIAEWMLKFNFINFD